MIKWRRRAACGVLMSLFFSMSELAAANKQRSTGSTNRTPPATNSPSKTNKIIDTTLELELEPLPPPTTAQPTQGNSPDGSGAPSAVPSQDNLLIPPQQIQPRESHQGAVDPQPNPIDAIEPLPPPVAWYEHWWVWASIGGALLLGGGLTAYFLTRPSPPGYDGTWKPGGPIEPAVIGVQF